MTADWSDFPPILLPPPVDSVTPRDMTRLNVLLLCGGRSAEHEVSLLSARNVVQLLDSSRYAVHISGIDRDGRWYLLRDAEHFARLKNPRQWRMPEHGALVTLVLNEHGPQLVTMTETAQKIPVDVAFPVLHGPYGEDGTIQGLCKLMGLPCVGPSVLGSAIGMDKEVMKRLLRDAGIPVAPWQCVRPITRAALAPDDTVAQLGLPLFVKPANMGSSVGVHKVQAAADLPAAVDDALRYDSKVLIESAIVGREIECSVLGGEVLRASVPGEIVTSAGAEFYSYDAKYISASASRTVIPAELTPAQVGACQALAVRVCRTLECDGMTRVDCFLTPDGQFVVNEINTIPGFTNISMYPKMWEASGVTQMALVDELIDLACARFAREHVLQVTPNASAAEYSA